LEAGVPLGVTFTFLVASPMVNEVAVILLLSSFGIKVTGVYILSGLLIAIFSGLIIAKLKVENLINDISYKKKKSMIFKNFSERISYAKEYTFMIFKKVWIYIVIGVGIGAFMHGYVPSDFFVKYAGNDAWYAVPFAVLLGIPLYSNAAGIVPLISVLTEKGVSIGTSLAFMMAVTGLSLPEFMILKRVMKIKLIIIFASIVGGGIIFTGYLFNIILNF
jgi:hypothetical protein